MNSISLFGKALLLCFLVISLSMTTAAQLQDIPLSYDQNGNLKQGINTYSEYNEFNQLLRVRDGNAQGQILEEYLYDGEGQRLKKYEPLLNQTTYYVSDDYIEVVNSTGAYQYAYYHDGDTLVGRKDPDGKKYFYHPDHLGSTDVITDQSGNIAEQTTYDPYGEEENEKLFMLQHTLESWGNEGL